MHRIQWATPLIVIWLFTPLWPKTTRLFEALNQDLQSGKISRATALRWELQAAADPDQLPAEYRGCEPVFSQSPTVLAAEARQLLAGLSGEEARTLQLLLMRPTEEQLPLFLITANGKFKIHYTTSGRDSCSEEYAQEVVRTFDYLYTLEVETLGFQPPPDDQGVDGPEYDIYLLRFYPYGETVFENAVPNSNGMAYTSFMKIDRNFLDPRYFTSGLNAMHVTCAHEFFHMIQGGYRFFLSTELNSVFLFEASSTWMEDVAFDSVNDYLQYVQNFMRYPNHAFNSAQYQYGLAIYLHMLSKQHGTAVVRSIWEAFRDQQVYDALQAGLKKYNDSLEGSLVNFTIWNCFTADRADTAAYYPEGNLYPLLAPKQTVTIDDEANITGSCDKLVSHYNLLEAESGGDFTIIPTLEQPADWVYGAVVIRPDGSHESHREGGDEPLVLTNVPAGSQIWICPTNVEIPNVNSSSNPLQYTFRLVRDGTPPKKSEGILAIFPSPFRADEADQLEIEYRFNQTQNDTHLYILSETGRMVFHDRIGLVPPGINHYNWSVRDQQGRALATGVYLCLIRGDRALIDKFAVIR